MSRWSLELKYAGRTFDLSDQVDVQLTASFSVFSGTIAEIAEVSFTLDLGIDIPAFVEAGYDLSGATGTLSLDGDRVLVGRAIKPVYGDPREALGIVRLTLRESVIDDTSLVPGPLAKVDSITWPLHDPNVRGRIYPEVFGSPGNGVSAGSPAYLLDTVPQGTQYILIAGHTVRAQTVKIHNVTDEFVESYIVLHIADGRGAVVAVVDAKEHGGAHMREGDELWCEWSGEARSGAAGDVTAHYLSQSAVRIDPGRTDASIQGLNSYILAGYFDERVSPLEWVADNLMPILPFTLGRDVDGLFPLVYQHHITESEAAAHLVVGPDCLPSSPVTYDGDPLTEYSLEYRQRADTGDYLATAVADESNNGYAEAARNAYRGDAHDGRYADSMATDLVSDGATADRIVAQIMERRALRVRTVQYELDRAVWSALVRAGSFVTITDPDRAWDRKPAWCTARTDTSNGLSVTLLIKQELTRDLH